MGPNVDPAGIAKMNDAVTALKKIAATKSKFASRADDSGTHGKERSLWKRTGVNQDASSGSWYLETGSGMGATLNTAVGTEASVPTAVFRVAPMPDPVSRYQLPELAS